MYLTHLSVSNQSWPAFGRDIDVAMGYGWLQVQIE